MILKQSKIREALRGENEFSNDPLWIVPQPPDESLDHPGAASIDLRLGRWFLKLKQTRHHILLVDDREKIPEETSLTERFFVRFGNSFVLHPGAFVLGATLEWIKIPSKCTGAIVGKSSWGRRGLIIETAPTVHPGFSGCLTLEITNLGEIPIQLMPGMSVCQLLLQTADGAASTEGSFDFVRRPTLGSIEPDRISKILARRDIKGGVEV